MMHEYEARLRQGMTIPLKAVSGYTVMELLVTVSLFTALTGISLLGIVAPQQLLERETRLGEVTVLIEQIQLEAMLKGQAVKVSFTPWIIWVNARKRLELPRESGWQWRTNVNELTLQPDGSFSIIDSKGRSEPFPKDVTLFYNQNRMAAIRLSPLDNTIQVVKAKSTDDTCHD